MRILENVIVIVTRLFKLATLILGIGFGNGTVASSPDLLPVTLQLKWQHQFQFAGYYAALEKGFYQDAGLDVTLLEAKTGQNAIQTVLDGQAEFGVGTSDLLLNYFHGDPVVVLAAIMQHSPLGLATLKTSGISNIHQLADEKLMIEPNSTELFAYFQNEGIQLNRLKLVEHSHRSQDLIDGKVQAMSVYTTDETFDFETRGLEYQLFLPSMSGIDFYGDNLFTTQTLIEKDPELVEAFRKASMEGWNYAMQNPEEVIDWILSKYSQRKTRGHLRYEAEKMRELMKPELVEIGYINPGRWQQNAHTYHQMGMLPENFNIDGMLYEHSKEQAYRHLQHQFYWLLAILLMVVVLAAIFYHQYHLANLRRQQFETLFLNAPVSLMEIDPQGVIHNWNQEAENTFQYKAIEVIGKNVFDLLVPKKNLSSVEAIISSAWKDEQLIYSENSNIRKDGEELLCKWANMPFDTEHKSLKRVICMARDVTSEKALEEKLFQAAHYDDLTGLPNRALVLTLLKEDLADAKRHGNDIAILFIDLNGFKSINDNYGHLAGDAVLKKTAVKIQNALRESDTVGRLSGDEFLAIVKDLKDKRQLQKVIDKIDQAILEPIEVEQKTLTISASIGCSFYPDDAQEVEELIRFADQSMYKVKAAYYQTVV